MDSDRKPTIFDHRSLETLRENENFFKEEKKKNTSPKEKQSKLKAFNFKRFFGDKTTLDEKHFPANPDPYIQDGDQLPDEKLPKDLLYKPLEDLDPYYTTRGSKTFCMATKKFGTDYIYRFSATKSLFLFSPFNPIRYWALRTILHPLFDPVIILVILVNCVFLALDNEIEEAEFVFTGIYTVEVIIKLIARGFILNQFTYLRDPWNWLDFIVVILAYATFAGSANLSGLRTFRVFRAFRSISIIPGLKIIVNSVLYSLKPLGEVLLIMLFLLVVVAIIALQAYQGILRRRCVSVPEPGIVTSDLTWLVYVTNPDNWNPVDGELIVCGNTTGSGFCPTNFVCLNDVGNNPNFGYTGFDNMGLSLLTSFQLITLDFWENVYNLIIRADGPWNVLFFLMSVFLGPFYLLNLLLAVIALAYTREEERQEKMKENREMYEEEQKRKRKKQRANQKQSSQTRNSTNQQGTLVVETSERDQLEQNGKQRPGENTSIERADKKKAKSLSNQQNASEEEAIGSVESFKKKNIWLVRLEKLQKLFEETFCCWKCSHCFVDFQSLLKRFVNLQAFEIFIMLCISVNTVFLAIDHQGISDELLNVLNVGNIVFTFIFTVEACLKITAFGPIGYIKDLWNLFDFAIVLISLVELVIELSGSTSGVNGLAVLRTTRLLRVFRLARSWGTMRKLVEIIWSTLGPVGYLTIIMFLILYIFAVITKQIFGPRYAASAPLFSDNEIPRWNCVDFYHSFLLVWRIMCGEWIEPLYDCLFITNGDGLCIFLFILIFLVANFLVLNLFTAILLGAFQVDKLKENIEKKKEEQRAILILQVIDAFKSFRRTKKPLNTVYPQLPNESVDNQNQGDNAFQNLNRSKKNRILTLAPERNQKLIALAQRVEAKNFPTVPAQDGDSDGMSRAKSNWRKVLEIQRSNVLSTVRAYEKKNQRTTKNISDGGIELAAVESNQNQLENGSSRHSCNFQYQATDDSHANYSLCSVLYCCCYIEREHKEGIPSNLLEDEEQSRSTSASTSTQDDQENKSEMKGSTTSLREHESSDQNDEVPFCFPKPLRDRYPVLKKRFNSPVFNYWIRLRKACKELVDNNYFEWFTLFLILGSTVSLAMEDAFLNTHPVRRLVLQKLEYIFTALFTLEMLLKWIGQGIEVYFTNFWSLLDFGIVAVSWVGIILDATNQGGQTGAFRSLRTLRALRPLRAVSRWEGMKIVVDSLIYCIPSIGNVILVCLLIWFVFGIMGVQFFKGGFFRCVDENDEVVSSSSIVTRADCIQAGYSWINPNVNFDHIGIAMVALFQVATFEGWLEVIADASDIRGVDFQPVRNFSQFSTIFFVIFVLVGSFFILNLIIGVIIESFQKRSKEKGTSSVEVNMTESQRQFYQIVKTMFNKKPKEKLPEPENKIQLTVFKFVTNKKFELAVFVLICLNMITLCMEHYQMTQTWTDVLRILDIIFTGLFGIEAILKIYGMRQYYFKDAFNDFDFLVVIVSIAGFILESLISLSVSPTLLRIVRVFRVFRVLRVIRAARGIRRLIITLVVSVPALFNIAVLLSVFLVIFSILGMNLFMHVQLMGGLNDLVNFKTFGSSLMLLFRLVTSAGWNEILDPLMNTRNCIPASANDPGNCGDPVAAILYMVAFIIITFLVIVNMYIAIILENFEEILKQEESGVSKTDIEQFYAEWAHYDPNASQYVTLTTLSDLLNDLKPPFQIKKPNKFSINALELPVLEGERVHCLDVLFGLVKKNFGNIEIPEEIKEEAENLLSQYFPNRKKVKIIATTLVIAQRNHAAKKIQTAWKSWKKGIPLKRRNALAQVFHKALLSRNERRDERRPDFDSLTEQPVDRSSTSLKVESSPEPKAKVDTGIKKARSPKIKKQSEITDLPGVSVTSQDPSPLNSSVNLPKNKQTSNRQKTVGSTSFDDEIKKRRVRTSSPSNLVVSESSEQDLIKPSASNEEEDKKSEDASFKPKIQNYVREKPPNDNVNITESIVTPSKSATSTPRNKAKRDRIS